MHALRLPAVSALRTIRLRSGLHIPPIQRPPMRLKRLRFHAKAHRQDVYSPLPYRFPEDYTPEKRIRYTLNDMRLQGWDC